MVCNSISNIYLIIYPEVDESSKLRFFNRYPGNLLCNSTWNWLKTWPGLEDFRYINLYQTFGRFNYLLIFGIHLFPTLMVNICLFPLYFAITINEAGIFCGLVFLYFTILAVLLEHVSDEQMHSFKADRNALLTMNKGLWKYSRHPNYLGEILFGLVYLVSLYLSL